MSNQVTVQDKMDISYMANGEDVKLTSGAVKKYLVKGNKDVTDQEVMMFISLCKYQKLNPFLNEAYLIKFGSEAQIVVGKEAFFKRAEGHESYDGYEAGIIVARNNEIIELNGCFKLETDVLLGGWAKVYRKDRGKPSISKVSLVEYDKKQAEWKNKPSTMIRKVALVQALREAFPAVLGAMYTSEEVNEKYIDVEVDAKQKQANSETLDFGETPEELKDPNPTMAVDVPKEKKNVGAKQEEPKVDGPDF